MIDLQPSTDRIKLLLDENTEASVIYAALEARLALEKVCYERLRQAHDYISHAQLLRWQPGGVVKTLMNDVDKHVTDTLTLFVSKEPAVPGVLPADADWVELGTQVGFNGKRVGELWNALSGLALHVKLPKSKDDQIPEYGDLAKSRTKVEEVLVELERLAEATMGFSGLGETVSFECSLCGEKNKRRAALLRERQRIFCLNPNCDASWKVCKQSNEIWFEVELCEFSCEGCGQLKQLPWRFLLEKLKFGDQAVFNCHHCDHKNYIEWRLTQVAPASEVEVVTKA